MDRAGLQALCKRHGLPARGSNVDLIARVHAALERAAGAEEEVAGVPARKGCLKNEAKKVTFAVEEATVMRLRSRVIWPLVVPKTMGKSAQASTDSAADDTDVPVRRSRRNSLGPDVPVRQSRRNSLGADVPVSRSRGNSLGADVPVSRSRTKSLSAVYQDCELRSRVIWSPVVAKTRGKSAQAGSVEVGADVPLRRSRRNSVSAAEAKEVEVAVFVRKRKRKNQENDEGVAVSAQVGASSRVTRRSSLAGAAALSPPAVEKKRGRGEAAPVQKSAQVEVQAWITRSRPIAPVVMSPTVVENKRRKTGDAQTNVELPTVSDVPRNDARVTRSLRNRVVQVNNSVVDANRPATKGPVRGSRRKSVFLSKIYSRGGPHCGRRKSVVSELHEKEKDVEKQLIAKKPVRRSSRKSVLPDMLGNNSGLLAAEMNAEMNVRRSTRKSVLPSMLNEENQDHNKMARNENFQSGECQDDERQQKVKEPIRRSRRSVAAVPLEEQNNGLYEEKISKIPMRRSTRKSVARNEVEKVSMDDAEIVAWEPERVGEEGLKSRKHRRSSLEISSSANDSWKMEDFDGQKFRKQQNAQIPNEKDNIGGTQQASNSTTLKGRSSKRRRTTASEEVRSVKEAKDDIIVREATKDAHKATHEYKESGSRVQESDQVNSTREEHSSGPLLVTVTLTDEISTAQSVPVVIPGSESGYNANESSDKVKQEHSDIQAVDSHLSETSGELDQSSCIAGLVPHNFVVSEDKALMSKDGLSINFNVGDREEQSPISGEGRVGLEANASESGEKNLADIMSTGLHAKSLQHDTDIIAEETGKVAEESIRAANLGKCPSRRSIGNPLSTSLHLEGAADDTSLPELNADKGCSSDGRPSSFDLELMFAEEYKESYSRNVENTAVEIDGGNKPCTPVTPGFYVRSDCLEDEDVQPTECDADKKLDVDEGVTEEVLAQEKCNDQHVPAKTDLKMKLNVELAGPGMESGCSITEKNERLVADILDQQAIILVQQGDLQEGDLEKPSLCSATPECKQECDLLEETVLPSRNTGSLPSAEQSPFSLESGGYGALASATARTENGFDDSKGCHVKSALKITHVSEPFSHHDTEERISKNDDCMHTSQQGNRMAGSPKANLDEERVLSVFSLDAKHIEEVINSEEVACEGEGSKKLVHSVDLKASSEKTDVNGPDGNACGISDTVLSSALHAPANDNYEICLGSNTDVLHQGHNDQCSDDTEDIIEDASAKCIERGIVLLSGKERSNLKDGQLNFKLEGAKVVESGLYFNNDINNILDSGSVVGEITPSGSGLSKDSSKEYRQEVLDGFSMETSLDGSSTCGEKIVCRVDAIENEGALSEEAARTMKNYAGTCSSNPKLMELQSLFSKGNTKESDPHDGLAFPSAENSGDESINVEQWVKVHHGSDLSHLDELIGCSNTEVLRQGHNHKDRSNVDRVEQVASEPCTNDIVEAAVTAKCIESGLVLPPSEERSNLNDGQLNPKLESPNIMVSGLNCDKDVCNTSDNGSIVVVVGERTPSGSGLPEDYLKDHYPRQELLDGFSVESSLQGTIFGKTLVSGVAGIGNPSSSLATPDYKYEGALSEEAVCRMKNYTRTSPVDPRHVLMDLQSLFSEGSTEKSDLQDNLAFPSAESGIDEHIICHVEKLVDTHVSSEPDTYQGPCQDLSRHEEKESCMSVPMQVKESGGFLRSSHMKGSVTSAQIDLADDAHLIERQSLYHMDIVATKEVLCEEKEERKSMPTSDSDILHEKSYSNGHDEQLKPELDGDEVEKHSLNCETDTSQILGAGSMMSKTALLPKDARTIYCEELELSNGLSFSLFKFAEESSRSGICQPCCQKHIAEADSRLASCDTEVLYQDHKEECSEPNADKFTAKARENNMTEDAPIEGTGSSIMLPSVVGTSEMADEQLNTKMSDERICQSSRRRGIDELRAKRQSFKVFSTVKGSYIAKSAPRPKPGDSLSQSAIALHRNRGNTTAVKVGHPVKPNADRSVVKDSSRRDLQPISRGPRDSLSQSAVALPRNRKNTTAAVKSKDNKPWL